MKILLANLHWAHDGDSSPENVKNLHFPMGLAIIAGEIRKNRTDHLSVADNYVSDVTEEDILDSVVEDGIDCILLSSFLGNYQYRNLKKFVKAATAASPRCRVIIGGPMAATIPRLILENSGGTDERIILVVGEGEETILELLACLESGGRLSGVRGICFRNSGSTIMTEPRARIKDLDRRPYPAYDLFETDKYVDYVVRTGRCWETCTSRGCFGECAYCKLVFGKKITMRSAASVVEEMNAFCEAYGVNRFNFVDDNFLNTREHALQFSAALKENGAAFKWRFQGRADRFSPDLAENLMDVGLYDVSFGIESGSPEILKSMSKSLNLERAKANLKSLPSDLETHASFIIGMPEESPETIERTLEFIADTGLKHTSGGLLTLFPGTALYKEARAKGIIADEERYCDSLGPVYSYPYTNLTAYPDGQLIDWAQRIGGAGAAEKGLHG